MSKRYPKEFRDDVVRVAQNRGSGVTLAQIAKDFGISNATLNLWLQKARIADGERPGATSEEAAETRDLRRGAQPRIWARRTCQKMMFPLVRELAVDGIPVTVTCRALNLCRAHYYRWRNKPISDRELSEAYLANTLHTAHKDAPEFGYRFLADEAEAEGHDVCERTVWRVGSANGWFASFAKPKRRNTQATAPATAAHDDLLERDFTADGPNQVWLTDITEHRTNEGKLYVCAVKDVWTNRIVGYSISDRMKARIAVNAVSTAVARRHIDVAGCIVHSDRGSQFRARKFYQALDSHGLAGSMGNVGTAADNAAMESFFSLLQKNVLNTRKWAARDELRIAIITWIERTYNRRRRQRSLERLIPIEYESIMTPTAALAA